MRSETEARFVPERSAKHPFEGRYARDCQTNRIKLHTNASTSKLKKMYVFASWDRLVRGSSANGRRRDGRDEEN